MLPKRRKAFLGVSRLVKAAPTCVEYFIYVTFCSATRGNCRRFTQSKNAVFIIAQHPPHMEKPGFRGEGGVNDFWRHAILKVSVEEN